jgi:hypothetical protein
LIGDKDYTLTIRSYKKATHIPVHLHSGVV